MASLLKVLFWYCFTGITSWHFWKKQSTGLWRKILIFNDHLKKNVNNLSKVIRVTFLVHEYKAPCTSFVFLLCLEQKVYWSCHQKKMYLANHLCLQVWGVGVLTISCKKKNCCSLLSKKLLNLWNKVHQQTDWGNFWNNSHCQDLYFDRYCN